MRGLEGGIERVIGRVRTLAYVEIEAWVDWNLVSQMEQGLLDAAPVWTDVKTFPSRQFYGRVHGITGGYPCQPFSTAGLRRGTDDPRHLWPYIARHINAIRPVWCFFENVEAHLTLGYREVRLELESMGYSVKEGIFSAAEAGAPHQRKRLFILAVENTSVERLQRSIGEPSQQGRFNSLSATGNGSVEYAAKQGLQVAGFAGQWKLQQEDRKGMVNRPQLASSVADTFSESRQQTSERGLDVERNIFRGCQRPEDTERPESFCGEGLAFANCICLQGDEREYLNTEEWEKQRERQVGSQGSIWPAPPGQPQYEWEAPRTVESLLGASINGYNHREDLLRLAGNAVVEQTAEIAFRTLWRKFGIEL